MRLIATNEDITEVNVDLTATHDGDVDGILDLQKGTENIIQS